MGGIKYALSRNVPAPSPLETGRSTSGERRGTKHNREGRGAVVPGSLERQRWGPCLASTKRNSESGCSKVDPRGASRLVEPHRNP
jgi:hypothetical protein